MLERSWTSTAETIVGRKEPLGLVPLLAIPLWTGALAVAGALGYGTYQSLFGTNSATFEAGWKEIDTFDRRMAAMHALWLKFDQDIQLRCPRFVTKDGGRWWKQFKGELNEFGAFYAKTGTHSWALTGGPTPVEIAGAVSHLETLIAWGQTVEQQCPGTFPGLGLGLTPSEVELAKARQEATEAAESKNPFSSFGANLGTALGIGAVGLLAFMWMAGKAERGFRGLEAPRRRIRRARR